MTTAPTTLPSAHEAVDWRALTPADATELLQLVNALEERDRALFRTSLTEVEEMLGRPGLAQVVGGYAAKDDCDALVAFGYVGLARSGQPKAICHGGVHPDCRKQGIGETLLQWQTNLGKDLLRSAFPAQESQVVHAVDASRNRFHAHLEALGYQWSHSFAELRRDVAEDLEEREPLRFMEIVPWSEGWDGPARRAFNRAATQSQSMEALSPKEWEERHSQMDRSLSFLAIDRSADRAKVAGLIEVGVYPEDWEVLGWKEGYIDTVAVFDPAVRTPVLEALIGRVVKALREAGMDKAAAGIDPMGDPEMMAFYSSVDFHPHVWWRHYGLPVSPVEG